MSDPPLPHGCVCVPARDEADHLPSLFAALAEQDAPPGSWSLHLLLDTCGDASAAVVERARARAPFPVAVREVRLGAPNAGAARAAALRMGEEALGASPGLLLTTDADSAPGPDWIRAARRALETCDLAAGRIVRTPAGADPPQDRLEAYYDRLYALRRRIDPVLWDPGPHHHFTGGANMAFRSGAYARLGGFAPTPAGEDALIVDEARRAGLRVRHDARMVVRTSSRAEGRAPGGLAATIRAGREQPIRVVHPADMAWQYAAHARARACHAEPSEAALAGLARRFGVAPAPLMRALHASPNAESFATRAVPAPPDARTVTLAEAEAALDALERTGLEQAA